MSKRHSLVRWSRISMMSVAAAAVAGLWSGCAYKIVRPETVTVYRAPDGKPEQIHYPMKVVIHNSGALWDPHMVKCNLIGMVEVELVRVLDAAIDILAPGPERRPIENGIEWTKNQYAKLPRCAAVNILGGFFYAMGAERLSYSRQTVFLPRFVYLFHWFREIAGEMNRVAGYAVPGQDTLIPKKWVAGPNRAVDRGENAVAGAYVWFNQGWDWCLEQGIWGGEWVWGSTVWVCARPFVREAKPVSAKEKATATSQGNQTPPAQTPTEKKPGLPSVPPRFHKSQ